MNALGRVIAAEIGQTGPISVARYMTLALLDPRAGYYTTRDPFGAAGDFITAPEISQMFGELIGLWAADLWQRLGAPPRVVLAELGPGRGTLMADALRAARALPAFRAALTPWLVEASPRLAQIQAERLAGSGAQWADDLAGLPGDAPLIVVANEFFDALPIRQFVRRGRVWHERLVGLDDGGALAFALAPEPGHLDDLLPAAILDGAPDGAVAEICPAGRAIAGDLGRRLAAQGGGALIIDYGPPAPGTGDSFQAVRRHGFHKVLADPGQADLTAHVDFAALAAAARAAGAAAWGPIGQGDLLQRLGLAARAAALARANPGRQAEFDAAVARLTAPDQMGTLFQALALTGDAALVPAAFP